MITITNSNLTTPRLTMFLIVLAAVSCDTLSEDQISPDKQLTFGQTNFYAVYGSALFMDVTSFIDESFVDATLVISTPPSKGVLSRVDDVLLRYEPYEPDEDYFGDDALVLSVRIDGKTRHTETINIIIKSGVEEFPCGLYAIDDNAAVVAGLSVAIPVLENDGLCGAGSAAPEVSIYSSPAHGEASSTEDGLTYTPGSTFAGSDEFIYKVTARTDMGDRFSYAAVKIVASQNWIIETLEVPEEVYEVYFPDEMTGFIAGTKMYKTTNGGESWTQLTLPTDGEIQHLQFLNKDLGFATYTRCELKDSESNCAKWSGGFLKTSDGGESWDLVNLNAPTASVFFTSPTTGYVSVGVGKAVVYKTEDAGEHWEEVFSSAKELAVEIEFANNNIGYLWGNFAFYITKDAGKSWQDATPGGAYLVALAVTKDFAFSCSMSGFETPSSIERSTHGGNWQPVMNSPYDNLDLGFSPSGNLGITVGLSEESWLARTADQGETWKSETGENPMAYPLDISVPSDRVAYILSYSKLFRYSNQ